MPRMPEWVAMAYKKGWARSFNQMLQLDYPPGSTRFFIHPKLREATWLVYGWNYGEIDPAGPTSDFNFVWEQEGILRFKDYMVHSTIDFTYPVFLEVTENTPVLTVANNNTGQTQTVDFTIFIAIFEHPEDYEKWSKWFEQRYGMGVETFREIFGKKRAEEVVR